jgi:hypothetical protein
MSGVWRVICIQKDQKQEILCYKLEDQLHEHAVV